MLPSRRSRIAVGLFMCGVLAALTVWAWFAPHAPPIKLDSEFWIGHAQQAQAYEQLGRHEAALEALTRAGRFSGGNHMTLAVKGHLLATLGRTAEAREVLQTLEEGSRERYVPPITLALVHAGLGERARVFEWLEKAYRAHDVHLAFLPVDPRWAAYRADPRFLDFVGRCGFRGETTR